MKLDPKGIRYLTPDDWRVLTAVEMGSRNHEIVPVPLISQIASLRSGLGGTHKSISALAKANLVSKIKNAKYDGYRLTYGGLDYLALNSHRKSNCIYSAGNQIGVGKESDIFVVASPAGTQHVLKIHRLGRISFRTVKANRDYLRNRSSGSWMYMSRLAATKEYAFMRALRDHGFPVPEPLAQNRHTVVMSLVDGFPLRQISSVPDVAGLYSELMGLIVRLAEHGLIHGDFNEFNIMIEEQIVERSPEQDEDEPPDLKLKPIIIDFPQMVSMSHLNAQYYFDRDVACIQRFFARRFKFTSDEPGPLYADAKRGLAALDSGKRLDALVEASGFSKKMAKELESYMKEVGVDGDGVDGEDDRDAGHGESDHQRGDDRSEDGREAGEDGSDHEDVPPETEETRTNAEEEEYRDGKYPTSLRIWPTPSPVDIMTPLDIRDGQFTFSDAAALRTPNPVQPRKSKAEAGWAI